MGVGFDVTSPDTVKPSVLHMHTSNCNNVKIVENIRRHIPDNISNFNTANSQCTKSISVSKASSQTSAARFVEL